MAPRGPYGLHALLDQASIISLTAPASAPTGPRRHPSPSPEIGNWRPSSLQDEDFQIPVKQSFSSPPYTRNSLPANFGSSGSIDDEEQAGRSSSQSLQPTADLSFPDDHDWPATWHSRDAEMWHDRISPRRAPSPSSLSGPRIKRSHSGPLEITRRTDTETEWKKTRARESSPVPSLQGRMTGVANASVTTTMAGNPKSVEQREKMSTGGTSPVAAQRRSRRHSALRRPERPAGFSNRQAMAILGKISTRTGSSAESGSTSASPEASSGSSGVSGLLMEEAAGVLDGHGWKQWTKELADALDECIPGEKLTPTESVSPREGLKAAPLAKAESLRSLDSDSGRFSPENSLLRSISLDRGIGETLKSLLSDAMEEQFSGESRSVKGVLQKPNFPHSNSVDSDRSLAISKSASPTDHIQPSSMIMRIASESSLKPRGKSSPSHSSSKLSSKMEAAQKNKDAIHKEKSKSTIVKYNESTEALTTTKAVPEASSNRHLSATKVTKDTEYTAWAARRTESQMKVALKNVGHWLEAEGVKIVGRLPLTTREMALVISQVAEGAERQITTESESLSFAGECTLRRSVETLLQVFERQVVARNEKAVQAQCRQVMVRALEEAQVLLEEAAANHPMRGKRRFNICQDILPSVKQTAASRFRGHLYGFLTKGVLQQLQTELVHEIEQLAEAMGGGRGRGTLAQRKPAFR